MCAILSVRRCETSRVRHPVSEAPGNLAFNPPLKSRATSFVRTAQEVATALLPRIHEGTPKLALISHSRRIAPASAGSRYKPARSAGCQRQY